MISAWWKSSLAGLCISLLVVTAVGCDRGEVEDYGDDEPSSVELPAENATIALDEGGFDVPVSIEVPLGSEVKNDSSFSLDVIFDEQAGGFAGPGRLFSLRVEKTTDRTKDLDTIWERLLADQSVPTEYELIERTEDMLYFTETNEMSGQTGHGFRLLVEVDDETTLLCRNGVMGGFSEEQAQRQIQSCRSLAAK